MVFILKNIWILEKIQWNITTWRKDFYCHLNNEVITNADHAPPKLVCKDFDIKYNDLYVQSDALLIAHVFENFINIYLKIYELAPAKCFQLQD